MKRIDKIITALAASFCGIAVLSFGVGYAAWAYSTSADPATANIDGQVGTWTLVFPKQGDGGFVDSGGEHVDGTYENGSSSDRGDNNGSLYEIDNSENASTLILPTQLVNGEDSSQIDSITRVSIYDESEDPYKALTNASSITEIDIPKQYEAIDWASFCYMENLTTIKFYGDDSTTASSLVISGCAFFGDKNLSYVELPSSLSFIGYGAFYCEASDTVPLTIVYDGTIKQWMTKVNKQTDWCYKRNITGECSDASIYYDSSSYNASSRYYPETVTYYDSATTVEDSTFDTDTALISVTFGSSSSLTSIGQSAFYNCIRLSSVGSLPTSLTSIGDSAFAITEDASTTALSVKYAGNKRAWSRVTKGTGWDSNRTGSSALTVSYNA
ncbi:MAG: leucine-rich repeat domain-containing protein [Bacilli bacterium]|jgi:hypothetical protein|nr:leucine-rich repeat domain-containing protein [Bacilli bacterium]